MRAPATLSLLLLALTAVPDLPASGVQFYGSPGALHPSGVSIPADSALLFCAGSGTPATGAKGDTKAQALGALHKLDGIVASAGLAPDSVVFVRAYLAPDAQGRFDFAGWDAAWNEFFGAHRPRPARVSVGIPTLGGDGSYRIEIECVCSDPKAGPAMASRSAALKLPPANAQLSPFGIRAARIYDAVGVAPGAGLYWTPGTGKSIRSQTKDSDTYAQSISDLKAIQANLATVGLSYSDIVYLRAWLGPDSSLGGKFDYDGWNRAYLEFFNTAKNPHKPARTTMAIPYFGGGGAVEIEVVAAFPGPSPIFDHPDAANANLKTYMTPGVPWADGVGVKAGSRLYFSSSVGPNGGANVHDQAITALAALKKRLAEAGLTFADVAFLHCYLTPGPDGQVDRDSWNAAYRTCFDNPQQPHKPSRTTLSVSALHDPSEKIQIDAVAAAP